MNLVYGEIVAILPGQENRVGKVRVGGALKLISIDLLTDVVPGDKVLLCEGMAIGKVDESIPPENAYVSGHTW